MIIALTGHRPNKLGNEYTGEGPISTALRYKLIDILQRHNPDYVISGMALGADTIWAKVSIGLGIPLIAAVPFKGQESMWPIHSQTVYHQILAKAKEVIHVCDPGYAAWKMQKRNEWMVDHCNLLIAVWDGTNGGTANCVRYAVSKNKTMERINPTLLR